MVSAGMSKADDPAFACRWLPPSVWKAVNGDDSPI
jgi:hypothetical protein